MTPAERFDFKTRLDIQEVILARLGVVYAAQSAGQQNIADRTPIDLMAYTMSEAIGDAVGEADQRRFAVYVQNCFDMTKKWFSMLMLIQPGIALVPAEGKAVANAAYIEHLNSLMFGLSCDPRLTIPSYYMRREYLTLEDRLQALENSTARATMVQMQETKDHLTLGGMLQ